MSLRWVRGEKAEAEPVEEDDAFLGRFQLARRLDGRREGRKGQLLRPLLGTVSRPVVPPFARLRPAGSDLSRYPDIALDSSRRYSMQMRPAIFVTFLFCYGAFPCFAPFLRCTRADYASKTST